MDRTAQETFTDHLALRQETFLEWSARGGDRRIDAGADTFLIRDGRVVVQTTRYTVAG